MLIQTTGLYYRWFWAMERSRNPTSKSDLKTKSHISTPENIILFDDSDRAKCVEISWPVTLNCFTRNCGSHSITTQSWIKKTAAEQDKFCTNYPWSLAPTHLKSWPSLHSPRVRVLGFYLPLPVSSLAAEKIIFWYVIYCQVQWRFWSQPAKGSNSGLNCLSGLC